MLPASVVQGIQQRRRMGHLSSKQCGTLPSMLCYLALCLLESLHCKSLICVNRVPMQLWSFNNLGIDCDFLAICKRASLSSPDTSTALLQDHQLSTNSDWVMQSATRRTTACYWTSWSTASEEGLSSLTCPQGACGMCPLRS